MYRPIILLLPILLLAFVSTLHAHIIHVPGDSTTIQGGINGAVDGDTVLIAPGTYIEQDINFRGKAITVMGTDPKDSVVVASTIVDGTWPASDIFVFSSGEDETSVLSGLTIRDGKGRAYQSNGAVTCRNGSSPTISYNLIVDNDEFGIYCEYSSPKILNNWIARNASSSMWHNGGGILLLYSSPLIAYNTIRENHTDGAGGGITGNYSSPNIISNRIVDNVARDGGGVAFWGFSYPYYRDNVIVGNVGSQGLPPGGGGGIYHTDGGIPIIVNNLITDNRTSSWVSDTHGGGIYCKTIHGAIILNNVIAANTAVCDLKSKYSRGGGVFIRSPWAYVWNNTIVGNTADRGGGLYLTHLTGGGEHEQEVSIVNSILWGNQAQEGDQIYLESTYDAAILALRYTDVEGGRESIQVPDGWKMSWGPGMIDEDPIFEDSEYCLSPGSPCVDTGHPGILDRCRPSGLGEERSDMGGYGGEDNCEIEQEREPVGLWILANGPAVIPRGYGLSFTSVLRNNTSEQMMLDLWFIGMSPDSTEFLIPPYSLGGPNPTSITLPSLSTTPESGELLVPIDWNPGIYSLIARAGSYPDSVVDEARLDLIVRQARVLEVPGDYSTIQEGIDAALRGDTVQVAAGIYTGGGNQDISFRGKSIVVTSESGPEATVIDCGGIGRGFIFDSGEDINSVLKGFTIRNGNANGAGGVFCSRSSPLITNNIITQNYNGGVFCEYNPAPLIANNVIRANSGGKGGGIRVYYSSPILLNNTIVGNTAYDEGGAIYADGGSSPETLTVINNIFWDNTAPGDHNIRLAGEITLTIKYSDLPGGERKIHYNWPSRVEWGPGNIDADPLFLLPEQGDYRLLPGSPCIDAGTPGSSDPDMTRQDMGPFYFDQNEQIVLYLTTHTTGVIADDLLRVTYTLINPWSYPESFDLISYVIPPDNRRVTILGPEPYTLQAEETLQFDTLHEIPEYAPNGTYQYRSQTIHTTARIPGKDSFYFSVGD